MSVHIFVLNEKNYEVCIRRGIAGIPHHDKDQYNDALISRMAPINKGDSVLFYIMDAKELRGIYRVMDKPFFDTAPIWESQDPNRVYPFRVRIENSDYVFESPIKLNDVYDLKDNGLMWTFSLQRPGGASNTLFSITNDEFQHLFRLFLKLNPVMTQPSPIREPYPYHEPNLLTLSMSIYNSKRYEEVGKELTGLFNEVRELYFQVKDSDKDDYAIELREMKRIENQFIEKSISKQIFGSDWFAHYKFFFQMQIDWIKEGKSLTFWKDYIPKSFVVFIIIFFLFCWGWYYVFVRSGS